MTSDRVTTEQPPRTAAPGPVVWPMACLVFAAGLAWFLIGTNDMALIDRDEPMIAEVARQMVHRNEWLAPHLPAWENKSIFKPPMTMWAMAASFTILGISELAARLPSVICSALTVTILFAAGYRRWGLPAGLVAAGSMALSLMPAIIGRMAITDPLLTLLATIILLCLERSLRVGACSFGSDSMVTDGVTMAPRTRGVTARNFLMWVALGLSFLVKGPALLAFLGPVLVLTADRGRWRPYLLFLGGALLIVLPGYVEQLRGSPETVLQAAGAIIAITCAVRWIVPVRARDRIRGWMAWSCHRLFGGRAMFLRRPHGPESANGNDADSGPCHPAPRELPHTLSVLRLPVGLAWGLPLSLAIGGWWFCYIAYTSSSHHQSLQRYAGFEVLTRLIQPIEGHWGPPGYYVIVAMVGLLPFSALLPGLLRWSLQNRQTDPTIALLLAWIVGPWLLWEVVVTKLPHYILPAMPAVALLAAMAWCHVMQWKSAISRKQALALCLPLLLFAVTVTTIAVIAWSLGVRRWLVDEWLGPEVPISSRIAYLGKFEPWQVNNLLLVSLLVLITPAMTWLLARQRSLRLGLLALAAGWTPALLILLVTLLSRNPFSESLSRQAAEQALAFDRPGLRYFAVGYTEPGVFFYLPADRYQRIERPRQIVSLARINEPFVLISNRKLEPDVRKALAGRIADTQYVAGLNAAKGQSETACVFRIAPAEPG